MPRIEPLGDPSEGSSLGRIMKRRPEIAGAWSALSDTVRFTGLLPNDLKEAVRASTAGAIGCEFCASIGDGPPSDPDTRTSLAIAVARLIVEDHGSVDEKTFAVLREEFSEEEIVELLALICIICVGGQTFGSVTGVEAATEEEAEGYRRSKARRIAEAGP
jgi:alkylhydroperoxidase family enzyme